MSDHHEHHHEHDEHHQHENQHHDSDPSSTSDFVQPSAPQFDNGYVVVPPTPQSSVDPNSANAAVDKVLDLLTNEKQQEDIHRMLADLSHSTDAKLSQLETIIADADSSSSLPHEQQQQPTSVNKSDSAAASKGKKTCSESGNPLCPYYMLACDRLSKLEIPPKVKDLLLWKNPKLTGAIFATSLILLISIASFSLLTVVSALFLTALTLIGSYRFYLALIFRIKGTYDNTFDKLSAQDLSLPKDKVQNLAHLLETDFNKSLNKFKSILLWDNVTTSAISFFVFYVVYCIGCMFNTITLLILSLVSAFTLPKVYDVYKQPIDQAIEKATSVVHQGVREVMKKVPMLNKKKTQ